MNWKGEGPIQIMPPNQHPRPSPSSPASPPQSQPWNPKSSTLHQTNPNPSVLLNSHLDSVPAKPHKGSQPHFSAHHSLDGKIFDRGAQDDKCIGMQILEAIKNLLGIWGHHHQFGLQEGLTESRDFGCRAWRWCRRRGAALSVPNC